MIIYVSTDNYRSISYSPIPGWPTMPVEVPDNFSGGNKTYNPETGTWVIDPAYVMTQADYIREAEEYRDDLTEAANVIMADWLIDLQLGVISDEDKTKLLAWRQYVKDVKATDISLAPEVLWPEKPI